MQLQLLTRIQNISNLQHFYQPLVHLRVCGGVGVYEDFIATKWAHGENRGNAAYTFTVTNSWPSVLMTINNPLNAEKNF